MISPIGDVAAGSLHAQRETPLTLRLALLSDFPLQPAHPHGGVEAVARTLVSALDRRGDIEVDVVTTRSDVRRAYTVRLTSRLTVHYLPRLARLELLTLFAHDRLLVRRLLAELRPDVVHVHDVRYALACSRSGYRYALTVHGVASIEEGFVGPSRGRSRLRRALLATLERRPG